MEKLYVYPSSEDEEIDIDPYIGNMPPKTKKRKKIYNKIDMLQ